MRTNAGLRRSLGLVAVLMVTIGVLGIGIASATGDAQGPQGSPARVTAHSLKIYYPLDFDGCAPDPTCTDSPDPGGTFTDSSELFDNAALSGSPIGSAFGSCDMLPEPGSGMCNRTVRLSGGQITATGPLFGDDDCIVCVGKMAVVGGTRRYAGAYGVVALSCNLAEQPFYCEYAYRFTTPT